MHAVWRWSLMLLSSICFVTELRLRRLRSRHSQRRSRCLQVIQVINYTLSVHRYLKLTCELVKLNLKLVPCWWLMINLFRSLVTYNIFASTNFVCDSDSWSDGAAYSGGGASTRSYDTDVVMSLVVVLILRCAGHYCALEASVNSILLYCIYQRSLLLSS